MINAARILTLIVALALLAAPTAGSHNSSRWYWNNYKAEARITADGIEYADGSYSEIATLKCFGRGNTLRGKNGPLYRHFRCLGVDTDDYRINVLLHTKGKNIYVLTSY